MHVKMYNSASWGPGYATSSYTFIQDMMKERPGEVNGSCDETVSIVMVLEIAQGPPSNSGPILPVYCQECESTSSQPYRGVDCNLTEDTETHRAPAVSPPVVKMTLV